MAFTSAISLSLDVKLFSLRLSNPLGIISIGNSHTSYADTVPNLGALESANLRREKISNRLSAFFYDIFLSHRSLIELGSRPS